MSYQLSLNKQCHNRDLRCLDYYHGMLVTGSADKTVKYYSVNGEKIQELKHITIFEKNILSVKINRKGGSQIFALVGCGDGKIFGLDISGTPVALFQHNSQISSIDFINSKYFVTGSWDGKAIVWSIQDQKKVSEYSNHKHAVCVFYNQLNDQIISGSQDKALAAWSWRDGKQRLRKQGVHGDIIRQISVIPQLGFITCSNDETIKIWTSDLQQIQHYLGGHSAFIFTVKCFKLGQYISAGQDKSIKLWKNDKAHQTLQCPASIWSLSIDQSGDIYAGCSDGYLRVFTTNPNRKAPLKVLQAYNKLILDSASKKSGMSAQQINKLPTFSEMMTIKGKKQGQIRVCKNGLIPEAYMWQNSKWDKIGEVITENNQGNAGMSQSKYYPGDGYFQSGQYDYIFDVDDESGVHKQIPFNDGANALQAAEKYCMREGLSKGYIEQIRKFLMQNSSNIPRTAIKASKKQVSQKNLKNTPSCIPVEFSDIKNPTAVIKKINEYNNQIDISFKLNERQISHCTRITNLLENSKNYHSWKLDFKELDTLKKLLTWPSQYKLPVWDIFRAFLCHYQSQAFFSGLDAGFDIVSQLSHSLEKENSQAFYALVLRTLSNIMIQNTNKNGIIKCSDIVFLAVENFSKRSQLTNKSMLSAVAGFLFNFSVTLFEKKLENSDSVISCYARVVRLRIKIDQSEENRQLMLQGVANVMFKYQEKKNEFSYIKDYLKESGASQDIRILLDL